MAIKPHSEQRQSAHRLTGHELESVKHRLAQIEAELKFPGLTDTQAVALEEERLVLLSRVATR
jgi:hypothetical protein